MGDLRDDDLGEKVGIITPVKNEIENLPRLINSVVNQSLRPQIWVIVDDGSTDGSSDIIENVASKYSWIQMITLEGTSEYDIRKHYSEVIYRGYEYIFDIFGDETDYYMVVDGDMRISQGYVAHLTNYMRERSDVAIACGGIYVEKSGRIKVESRIDIHPAGGATAYDGDFYRTIGGPPQTPTPDSVAEAKARMMGYETKYLADSAEIAIQSRPTGQKGNIFRNALMRGSNIYTLGYHPAMLLPKAVLETTKPPYYLGIGLVLGYLSAWKRGAERVDEDVVRYYRRRRPYELAQLGKRKLSKRFRSDLQPSKIS